jgi:tetratricopeptide (TPR) repeat protein
MQHQAMRFAKSGRRSAVRELVAAALAVEPTAPFFLAERLILNPPEDPVELSRSVSTLARLSGTEAIRVGVSFWQAKDYRRAAAVFESTRGVYPEGATLLTNLAVNYAAMGKWDEAERAFRRAIAIDPSNEFAQKSFMHAKKRRLAARGREPGQHRTARRSHATLK